MSAGGVVMAGVGVWIGCQVFGGQALERLGILKGSPDSAVPDNPVDKAVSTAAGGLPGSGLWAAEKLAPGLPPVSGLGAVEQLNRRGVTGTVQDGAGAVASAGKKIGDLFGGIGGLLH